VLARFAGPRPPAKQGYLWSLWVPTRHLSGGVRSSEAMPALCPRKLCARARVPFPKTCSSYELSGRSRFLPYEAMDFSARPLVVSPVFLTGPNKRPMADADDAPP